MPGAGTTDAEMTGAGMTGAGMTGAAMTGAGITGAGMAKDGRATAQAIADRQHGLVTRRQLYDAGLSPAVVRAEVRARWSFALPGVVHLARGPLTEQQRLVAASLLVGGGAMVTGAAAAALHGLTNARADGFVDVLVPTTRASRTVGFVRTVRTDRLPTEPRRAVGGLVRLAPPARAVADACRRRRDVRYAEALVIEAVQRDVVTLRALFDELGAGPVQHSRALRHAVDRAAEGAWSAPESELVRLCSTSTRLPVPWTNPRLTTSDGVPLPTPDLWFDDVGLAVQVHSRTHHAAGPDWERTVRTDSVLAEAGVLRIAVTPSEIYRDGEEVVRRLERVHGTRSTADRPAVVAVPRLAVTA